MNNQRLPFISVLINCFNRKDYVLDALLGLSNQSADKEIFEVVLITDYIDSTIIRILSEFHFHKLVIETTPILGDRLVSGLNVATGEIIVLHDDDDIFLPEKILDVYNVFQSDEQIAYYHNNFRKCNIGNTKVQLSRRVGHSNKQIKNSICLKTSDLTIKTFRELISHNCDFNASCIAIRRSAVNYDLLYGLPALEDTTFFVMGLISDRKIYISNNVLTIYRIHGDNNSIRNEKIYKDLFARKARFSNRQIRAILMIRDNLTSYNLQNYLYLMIDYYLNLEMLPALLFSNQNSKLEMIRSFWRLLKGEKFLDLKMIIIIFLLMLLNTTSKKLFSCFYFVLQ